MPEITLVVRHEAGLHARPAALFVNTAKRFECEIRVTHDESEANAKSILSVLTLGANRGAEVTVRAEGQDADEALDALTRLVQSDFEVEG